MRPARITPVIKTRLAAKTRSEGVTVSLGPPAATVLRQSPVCSHTTVDPPPVCPAAPPRTRPVFWTSRPGTAGVDCSEGATPGRGRRPPLGGWTGTAPPWSAVVPGPSSGFPPACRLHREAAEKWVLVPAGARLGVRFSADPCSRQGRACEARPSRNPPWDGRGPGRAPWSSWPPCPAQTVPKARPLVPGEGSA